MVETTSTTLTAETKYYVRWYFPGMIVSETSYTAIESPATVGTPPEGAYAYTICYRSETVMPGGEVLCGPYHDVSGCHFLGGVILTPDQINDDPKYRILHSNMVNNGWDRVVLTRFGQAFPLGDDDILEEG